MTVTLNLTPEEETKLRGLAAANATDVPHVVQSLIASLSPPPLTPQEQAEALRALVARWKAEDEVRLAGMTPEEIAAEDAEWDTIQANIEEQRLRLRPVDLPDHA